MEDILWFRIADNFSDKLFNIQRERNEENKQVSLWIKDKTKRKGYQYFLPLDLLQIENKEKIVSDIIDAWDEKHNNDIYGNRCHVFTSSKVALDVIEKYYDYLNKVDLNNPEDQRVKEILKDGSEVEASEYIQNIYKVAINKFIMDKKE